MDDAVVAVAVILYLLFIFFYYMLILLAQAASIFSYVMQAFSLMTLAKRRGIERPWLAWVPVASSWLLGSISDQYRHQITGEDRNLRKRLLIQRIICEAVAVVLVGVLVFWYIGIIIMGIMENEALIVTVFFVFYAVIIAVLCAHVLATVFYFITQYKVLFDIYRSCDPKTSTLFFVLSFFSTVAISITLFLDRHKELGMPVAQEKAASE